MKKFIAWNTFTGDVIVFGYRVPEWYEIQRWLCSLVCKLRGHDWDCEGVNSSETGVEYFWCKRCGEEQEVIYY